MKKKQDNPMCECGHPKMLHADKANGHNGECWMGNGVYECDCPSFKQKKVVK